MFNFKNHPSGTPFWHGKLFTLEWELKQYRWVVIRYDNGERKAWYRRTERPYRFRRWFFRNRRGEFSNLTNIHSPTIEIYLLPWYLVTPKKVIIPMNVHRLTTADIPFRTVSPKTELELPLVRLTRAHFDLMDLGVSAQAASPSVNLTAPLPQVTMKMESPICTWPVTDWIESGHVQEGTIEYHQLQKLETQFNHA